MWIPFQGPGTQKKGQEQSLSLILTLGSFCSLSFSFSFLKVDFYLTVVALQHGTSFYHTAKRTSHMHTHLPSFLDLLPTQATTVH